MSVTNNPKLSPETTPKLTAPRFHSSAPVAPAVSSTPTAIASIGIFSPGSRNASASIARMPPNQTHTSGMTAK
jgi:hypothetical protein